MGAKLRLVWKIIITLIAVSAAPQLHAQLKADFTLDVSDGCSPLVVNFFNASTGASANAVYTWDFGNGATGHNKDGSSIYRDPKVYTVTLTLKDGANSSTTTKTVTVYRNPTVDFSFDPATGCAPLGVTFTSQSAPGDGSIIDYLWDFGDGKILHNANAATASHIYENRTSPPVSLTVTNSHGCYASTDKMGIEVLDPIEVNASKPQTVFCKEGLPVTFTNTSTGPGTLTYQWNFGDGQTSNEKTPVHIYTAKGSYPVNLTVISSEGCSVTQPVGEPVNIGSFQSDFEVPASICSNAAVSFNNTSSSTPESSVWEILPLGIRVDGNNLQYSFPQGGEYTVRLINSFAGCTDVVEKKVTVKAGPGLDNFQADIRSACGAPAEVQFSESSTTAVAWNWNFDNGLTATTKNPVTRYTANGQYSIALTVTNAAGCEQTLNKSITIAPPYVQIITADRLEGCVGLAVNLRVNTPADIKTYNWSSGDGQTSTLAQPRFVYNKVGEYEITLNYETVGGCKGLAVLRTIRTFARPDANFTAPVTQICGNTVVGFVNETIGEATQYIWNFGDGSISFQYDASHQYFQAGTFTVQLIAGNNACMDTIVRTDYITVTPPFPVIRETYIVDCEKPGEIQLFQEGTINQATQLSWDFGDGHSLSVPPTQDATSHIYTKSGLYEVFLTAVNGGCTVRDSFDVPVLLQQKPHLEADLTAVCGTGLLRVTISGLEFNPALPVANTNQYNIVGWEYGDGTPFYPTYSQSDNYFSISYTTNISGLENGKKDIRVIIQQNSYPWCTYTSNTISLDIRGPKAVLGFDQNKVCFETPIRFKDLSTPGNNIPIVAWSLDFADGQTANFNPDTYPASGLVEHAYVTPGNYAAVLTVTDAEGCIARTPAYPTEFAEAKGPMANFSVNPEKVFPNTTVQFTNFSNATSSNPSYHWWFSSGAEYSGFEPSPQTYTNLGTDTVRLIASDPAGCRDTMIKIIYIKDVIADFSYEASYINNNSCPPVVVRFSNASENAEYVTWNFGDGSAAVGQDFPTHTYYKAGIYRVVLYAVGPNGNIDSLVEMITIKGPYASISADTLSGCLSQAVTISAEVHNAISFTWDFGDGSLLQTTDTFALHHYATAGVYQAAIILKDGDGCSGSAEMPQKIVIDSLAVLGIEKTAGVFCDSATVVFTPAIRSVAADAMGQTLLFSWSDNKGQHSSDSIASFYYSQAGDYLATVSVVSPYGCKATAQQAVHVAETPKASISGPAEICINSSAQFSGSSTGAGEVSWSWLFSNGSSADQQIPVAQLFEAAGAFNQQLILSREGCSDTSVHPIFVHPLPIVTILPGELVVCLGNSVSLEATGAIAYQWSSEAGDNISRNAVLQIHPTETAYYSVTGTNEYHCSSRDSVLLTVAKPFVIAAPQDPFVCAGAAVELKVTGASSYQWINLTDGLSNAASDHPMASPAASSLYTVVGYDAYNCFTDTASVNVRVISLPAVQAPADMNLLTGDKVTLLATASADVVSYTWSPAATLSCATCAAPVAAPKSNGDYLVTVANAFGCKATDTVNITLTCAQDRVHIPNAFSPNNNGTNDMFYIMGRGVRTIETMRIFNRWGQLIFEAKNIDINDRSKGWNGYANGTPAQTGLYIYQAELICDTGEHFSRQGTVMLLR